MKISELNDDQKGHLVHLLDSKTHVGLITAGRIAAGEWGDEEIIDVFKKAGMSPGTSRRYAIRVQDFVVDPREQIVARFTLELNQNILFKMRDAGLTGEEIIQVLEETIEHCKRTKSLYEACRS